MHENERLVREGYEAMAKGDGSVLASLLTAKTEWIIHGEGDLAGTYVGPNDIFEFWKLVAKKTGGGLRLELRDVLANDERAVALVTARGQRDDKTLDERQVVIFEFEESKVRSASFIYERPQAYDQFWE